MTNTPQANRLRALIEQHGTGDSLVSAANSWTAFKDYGREIFDPERIGLLFQVGVYDFTGTPLFYFDSVCQFDVTDEEGEHDHYEQLHCELTCHPNEILQSISATLWSFDYTTADAFFAAVEAMPEFQAAMRQDDYHLTVTHEDV